MSATEWNWTRNRSCAKQFRSGEWLSLIVILSRKLSPDFYFWAEERIQKSAQIRPGGHATGQGAASLEFDSTKDDVGVATNSRTNNQQTDNQNSQFHPALPSGGIANIYHILLRTYVTFVPYRRFIFPFQEIGCRFN
jgi:hypothetical protein